MGHTLARQIVAGCSSSSHVNSMSDKEVDVLQLLQELSQGKSGALDRLLPIVYEELRRIAHGQLRSERPGHTLNTTALVHEAYLRLVKLDHVEWRDRAHF